MIHGQRNVICVPGKGHSFGKRGFAAGAYLKGSRTVFHFHGRDFPALGGFDGNSLVIYSILMKVVIFRGGGKLGKKIFPADFEPGQRIAVFLHGNFRSQSLCPNPKGDCGRPGLFNKVDPDIAVPVNIGPCNG